MTAVTIKNVDQALVLRYTGMTIDTGSPATPTPVDVFIEEPSSEEYPERTYPSVALKLMAVTPDFERSHSDDDDEEEIGYDGGAAPPVRTMRYRPLPFILTYSLDTWHRVLAGESRDLVTLAIIERTHPRGYVNVSDVDGGTEACWVRWLGGVANNDEEKEDYVIYHKSLTLEVLVDLLVDATERDVKVVTDSIWRTYQQRHKVDDTGKDIIIVSGEESLFEGMRITETDVAKE